MKPVTSVKGAAQKSGSIAAIEAYIVSIPEPTQSTLRKLREIIRSAVPGDAVEVMSYGFPAFAMPKPFFGYAAYKKHVSVFPFSGSFFDSFAEELEPYTRTKGSLHLPLDKVPAALIRKLVRARVASLATSLPKGSRRKSAL